MVKKGEKIEVASRYIKKINKLLDVGCGSGEIAPFLIGKVKKIYGVDKSVFDLAKARKKGILTEVVDLDSQSLPYRNGSFDAIACLDVVEHIKDPIALLYEIKKKLKTNGMLVVSTPNIRFSSHLCSLFFKGRFPTTSTDTSEFDGGHIHYFTFSDIKEFLEKLNFEVVVEQGIINKKSRGIKGQILTLLLGNRIMREFRSPGLLIVARKR